MGSVGSVMDQESALDRVVASSLEQGDPLSPPSSESLEAAFDERDAAGAGRLSPEELTQLLQDYGRSGCRACKAFECTLRSPELDLPTSPQRQHCTCLGWSGGAAAADEKQKQATLEDLDKYDAARRTFELLVDDVASYEAQCRMALDKDHKGYITKDEFVRGFADMMRPFRHYGEERRVSLATKRSPKAAEAAQAAAPRTPTRAAPLSPASQGKPRVIVSSTLSPAGAVGQPPRPSPGSGALPVYRPTSPPSSPQVGGDAYVVTADVQSFAGRYVRVGAVNGRPKYRSERGAIMYFDRMWKMSSSDDVSTYSYGLRASAGQPPSGAWEAPPFDGTRRGPLVQRA